MAIESRHNKTEVNRVDRCWLNLVEYSIHWYKLIEVNIRRQDIAYIEQSWHWLIVNVLNKVDKKKGAIFQSHIDGKKYVLSPEESIRIQIGLNSDIVMAMDECPKKSKDYKKIKKSMELSMYWAHRSKKAFGKNPHKAIFGIIQGSLSAMMPKASEDKINVSKTFPRPLQKRLWNICFICFLFIIIYIKLHHNPSLASDIYHILRK